MNKLIIFAIVLAFAASAYAACDTTALTKCATDWASCILSANLNKDSICTCNGKYALCWKNAGCASGSDWDNYLKSCTTTDGCTAAQCASASTISAVFGLAVAVVAALF